MIVRIMLVLFLVVSAITVQSARANDQGPRGVAVVVAPENGIWSCDAANPDAAFDCARKKCRDAGEVDCYRVTWCFPSGWGALYSVRTAEFHGPAALCGAPSREEAVATVERWCRAQEHVVACNVFGLLTPDGGTEEIDREFSFER